MRFLEKVINTLLAFVFLYTLIMIGVYHFIYPYPVGALDEMERRDGALTYRLINSRYLITFSYFKRILGLSIYFCAGYVLLFVILTIIDN